MSLFVPVNVNEAEIDNKCRLTRVLAEVPDTANAPELMFTLY